MSPKHLLSTASTITRVFGLFGFVLPLGVAISALAQEPEEHPVTFHVAGGLTTIAGSDAGKLDHGGSFQTGAGHFFNRYFGVTGNFMFNQLGIYPR